MMITYPAWVLATLLFVVRPWSRQPKEKRSPANLILILADVADVIVAPLINWAEFGLELANKPPHSIKSWTELNALRTHESRDRWAPGMGGMMVHSICTNPDNADIIVNNGDQTIIESVGQLEEYVERNFVDPAKNLGVRLGKMSGAGI